jgi:hypothetical protein
MSCPQMVLRRVSFLLGLAAVLATATLANATSITYGILAGPNVTYGSISGPVSENDTPGPGPYFGAPLTPPGSDILSFNPAGFAVQLLAPATGTLSKDGDLSVPVIQTNSNSTGITSLTLTAENGRYSVGGPINTSLAKVSLVISPLLITGLNGVALGTPIPVIPTLTFNYLPLTGAPLVNISTSSNSLGAVGSIRFITSGDEQPLDVDEGLWSASATFDIAAALAAAGKSGKVTQLQSFALDNTTTVTTVAGGSAYIDKKQLYVTPTLNTGPVVPEPSSILLGMLGGIGALVLGSRCRVVPGLGQSCS